MSSFSESVDLYIAAERNLQQAKRTVKECLFLVVLSISESPQNTVFEYRGYTAGAPKDASPLAIFSLVFTKGQERVKLTELANSEIRDNDSFGRIVRSGAEMWAERKLKEEQPDLDDLRMQLQYCEAKAEGIKALEGTIAACNHQFVWRKKAWLALAENIKKKLAPKVARAALTVGSGLPPRHAAISQSAITCPAQSTYPGQSSAGPSTAGSQVAQSEYRLSLDHHNSMLALGHDAESIMEGGGGAAQNGASPANTNPELPPRGQAQEQAATSNQGGGGAAQNGASPGNTNPELPPRGQDDTSPNTSPRQGPGPSSASPRDGNTSNAGPSLRPRVPKDPLRGLAGEDVRWRGSLPRRKKRKARSEGEDGEEEEGAEELEPMDHEEGGENGSQGGGGAPQNGASPGAGSADPELPPRGQEPEPMDHEEGEENGRQEPAAVASGSGDSFKAVSALDYRCESAQQARRFMDAFGVATFVDADLGGLITSEIKDAAITFGGESGTAIFLAPSRDAKGRLRYNARDEGRVLMVDGEGGQRWQASLVPPAELPRKARKQEADKRGRLMEALGKLLPIKDRVLQAMEGAVAEGEIVQKAVLLVNHPGQANGSPVPMQAIHTDLQPGDSGYVAFVPLVPYSVLVSPLSHAAFVAYHALRQQRLDQLLRGRRVTAAQEKAAIAQADEEAVAAVGQSVQKLVRLQVEPGQVVLLHGHTMHAGDRGIPGEWWPRIHFYVKREPVENETYPLEPFAPAFAKRFC